MLITLAVVLFILWALGFLAFLLWSWNTKRWPFGIEGPSVLA